MRLFPFNKRALVAVSLSLGVAGIAPLALLLPSASGARGTSHHRQARSHARRTSAGTAAFGVLHRPPNAADRQNSVIKGASVHDPNLEPDSARVLASDAHGTLWLIPKRDGELCLGRQPPPGDGILLAAACSSSSEAGAHGILLGSEGLIFGAVPDGVTSVTAQSRSGATTTIAVRSNAYRLPADTTNVRFSGPQGSESISLSDIRNGG